MLPNDPISVSEFIGLFNQTLEYAYPSVIIEGELANFKVSKNKWLYFDLKDNESSLKFFGTVYNLHTPLEDGMLLKVNCFPRLHNIYGLSMQVQTIELAGEGSIKRSALLLEQKLRKEGLFDDAKKRVLPYPPNKIGLITSAQSAAYADFIKIINSRWQGINIDLIDVQVQGEKAITDISKAIDYFNENYLNYDALVLIRGGGSPEDLAAFSTEEITRSVAASKLPTLVAIGHEIDISLAELAADLRASTPSNAAELLVPDKKIYLDQLNKSKSELIYNASNTLTSLIRELNEVSLLLKNLAITQIESQSEKLQNYEKLLLAYNPESILKRGYSIVRKSGNIIYSSNQLNLSDSLSIQFSKGGARVKVNDLKG